MRYLDVCAGISASTVAWKPMGWEAAAYSEIEAAPRAVLAHHYPNVPLHGDFTTIKGDEYGPIDLLVGGTPCQDFSIAGLREGLDGDRGNLSLEFLRLADRTRPRWLVWENVPGVLSIDKGRAFGAILGGMGQLGYGYAYRVLDAQHFGVPQRRRRVFVVGCLGDYRRAAAVLFERHCLSGHPAPRHEAGKIAPTIPSRSLGGGGLGTDFDCDGGLISSTGHTAHCLNAGGMGRQDFETETMIARTLLGKPNDSRAADLETYVAHSLRGEGFDASEDGTGRGTPLVPVSFAIQAGALRENPNSGPDGVGVQEAIAYTLEARAEVQAVAFNSREDPCHSERVFGSLGSSSPQAAAVAFPINPNALRGDSCAITPPLDAAGKLRLQDPGLGIGNNGDPADTLQAAGPGAVGTASAVRRLTPRECERLQGFPDDYTLVPYRKKLMADGPRYKALGNSMAVPCMRWIGERIAAVEALPQLEQAA